MARRFEVTEQVRTGLVSQAPEQAANSLSQRLAVFSRQQARSAAVIGAQQAAIDGAAEGTREGGPRLSQRNSLPARAFNQAALSTYQAGVRNDVREQLDTIESEFEADPEGYTTAAEAMREGVLEGAPEEIRPQLELEVDARIQQRRSRVQSRFESRERDVQRSELIGGLNGLEDDVTRAMREGDVELGIRFAEDHDMMVDDMLRTGMISAEQAAARRGGLEDAMVAQQQVGYTERALAEGGVSAGREVIKEFSNGAAKTLSPRLSDRIQASMQNLVSAREREDARRAKALENAQKAAVKSVRDQWKDAEFLLGEGRTPENLDDLVGQALATGDEDLIADVLGDVRSANAAAEFAALPKVQQDEVLRRFRDGTRQTATADQVRLLDRFESIANGQSAMLERDPLQLAVNKGIVTPLPPLDQDGALESRRELAAQAEQALGRPVPALTSDEIDNLADQYQATDAGGRLEMLAGLTDALGGDAELIFAELDKKNHHMLAAVGSISLTDPMAARTVLRGMDVMAADRKIVPPANDMRAALNEELGTAYMADPTAGQTARQAITAAYAAMSAADGELEGEAVNARRLRDAVRMVSGDVLDFNGHQLLAPAPGVDQDLFEDWLFGIPEASVDAMGGVAGVTSRDFLQALRGGSTRIVSVGQGQYKVLAENPRTGELAVFRQENGDDFVLRWRNEWRAPSEQ